MRWRMWTYDLAREQSPSYAFLAELCQMSLDAGYNALGLYLEHRFAYPSAPWAHGQGAVSPDTIRQLVKAFPDLQIVPFVNLLGHCEGLIYTEEGKAFREETMKGLQACPSCPEFATLCDALLRDVLDAFPSELVHIGGDETAQLGKCPRCAARVETYELEAGADGKAKLYGEWFGDLARRVIELGRRPALWADMFDQHPTALAFIPETALLFDWRYFEGVAATAEPLKQAGFEVVGCPALHTYNASWLHLEASQRNVREVADDVRALGLAGVCVTTWECGLFGSYPTLTPALRAAGRELNGDRIDFLEAYGSEGSGAWAHVMGIELERLGGSFAFGRIRSSLKCRLLLYSNPFLAWKYHADEYCGPLGEAALALLDRAIALAPNPDMRGVSEFVRLGIEFVRAAETCRLAYAEGEIGAACAALAPARQIFEALEKIAQGALARHGGSRADIERCRAARAHVETVLRRIQNYGDRSLGYLPAFEILTHPKFMPHDQASWWLINAWANE